MRVCANNCKNIHLDCFTFREGNFLMCLILTYNFCNNSYRYDTLVPSFPLNVFESRRICDKHRCLIPIPHMQHISLILSLFYTTGSARLLLPIPCYMFGKDGTNVSYLYELLQKLYVRIRHIKKLPSLNVKQSRWIFLQLLAHTLIQDMNNL